MTLPTALTTEIQKLVPSAIVELFVLDATALGGSILRFHAGTNGLTQNVVWQGNTYARFPVQISGFDISGQGQFPRPKMQVANIFSSITTILLAYNDLLGAKITRKRTLAKFLDAANFAGGVNATADNTAEFDEDIYYIDRKSNEDRDVVEFELAASIDLAGVRLPRRQIVQNICIWKYRGTECGFAGPPLYDANENILSPGASSQAIAVRSTFLTMQSTKAALDIAIAALSTATYTKQGSCEMIMLDNQFVMVLDNGALSLSHYGVFQKVPRSQYGTTSETAYWSNSPITLDNNYRRGALADTRMDTYYIYYLYYIEHWDIDPNCSAATSTLSAAQTTKDSAQTAYDSAVTAYNSAVAALPGGDAQYANDVCGKRLASCKIRFGSAAELPFGSFPASGLIR